MNYRKRKKRKGRNNFFLGFVLCETVNDKVLCFHRIFEIDNFSYSKVILTNVLKNLLVVK